MSVKDMVPASISISLGGSVIVLLLFLAGLAAAAILFYRYTLPPLPGGRRIILSALRALALSILMILIFEPVLRLIRTTEQRPVVAVLIDDSQSMSINDNSKDRSAEVHRFLRADYFNNLASGVKTEYFAFSSKLRPEPSEHLDSIAFKGEATNLSEAFLELKEVLTSEHIQAALLITDGNYTTGKNPVYSAEALGIPVSTIGVGDTTDQKDVLVEKVVTNNIAYAETRVPVDVTIKSNGLNGENVVVTVSEGADVLDRSALTLQKGLREYHVGLHVEPKDEGTKKYVIHVSNLPGELTEKNNTQSVFIKVLRSKLRVLLLAGAPSPDVAAVRQVLTEDQHLKLQVFVQKNMNEFYESGFSRAILDSADCIMFIGFPSPASSGEVLRSVQDVVEQRKKPLLFIGGRNLDHNKLRQIEPYLPFMWRSEIGTETEVFPAVVEREKSHSLITLGAQITPEAWQMLPPLYKPGTTFHSKPESEVLVDVKFQNIVLNEPLILIRNISGQKSFAITGYGVWRWRLMAQGDSQTDKFLSLLLTNAVRWLTTMEDNKNVRIISSKDSYTTTEPVEFNAQVYDDQLRPTENAEVKIGLQKGKETFDVVLNAIGNGRYEGSAEGLGEGDYSFTGKATMEGKTFGEDKGKFSIGEANAEFLETKLNKSLLEQIAFHTGGKYYGIADGAAIASDLNKSVKFSSKEIVHANEIELWNWQYLAAVLVVLFGSEWFLRKRSGML